MQFCKVLILLISVFIYSHCSLNASQIFHSLDNLIFLNNKKKQFNKHKKSFRREYLNTFSIKNYFKIFSLLMPTVLCGKNNTYRYANFTQERNESYFNKYYLKDYRLSLDNVIVTLDNGFLFTGKTVYNDKKNFNIYNLKVDQNLDVEWGNIYDSIFSQTKINAEQINNGDYIISGSSIKNINSSDVFFSILNTTGYEKLSYIFGSPALDYISSIVKTDIGGAEMIGTINNDIFFISVLNNSNVDNFKILTKNIPQKSKNILSTNTNNELAFTSVNYDTENYKTILLSNYKKNNILWQKKYSNYLYTIKETLSTKDNGYIILGDLDKKIIANIGSYILKLNDKGDILWALNFYTKEPIYLSSFTEIDNGDLLFFGEIYENENPRSTVIKLDSDGNLIWSKKYNINIFNKKIIFKNNTLYLFGDNKKDLFSFRISVSGKSDLECIVVENYKLFSREIKNYIYESFVYNQKMNNIPINYIKRGFTRNKKFLLLSDKQCTEDKIFNFTPSVFNESNKESVLSTKNERYKNEENINFDLFFKVFIFSLILCFFCICVIYIICNIDFINYRNKKNNANNNYDPNVFERVVKKAEIEEKEKEDFINEQKKLLNEIKLKNKKHHKLDNSVDDLSFKYKKNYNPHRGNIEIEIQQILNRKSINYDNKLADNIEFCYTDSDSKSISVLEDYSLEKKSSKLCKKKNNFQNLSYQNQSSNIFDVNEKYKTKFNNNNIALPENISTSKNSIKKIGEL